MRGAPALGIAAVLLLAGAAPALAELPYFDARAPAESPSAPPVALLPKAPAWKTLVILAVPRDLWSEELQGPDPEKAGGWYEDHGREWFEEVLGPKLREYLLRVTYGTIPLDIEVTPWLRLPRTRTEAAPRAYVEDRSLEARDALREARRQYSLEAYRILIVIDPTSPASPRFEEEWSRAWGVFFPRVEPGVGAVVAGTLHWGTSAESRAEVATARILAHEILHAVDFARDGRHDLHHNTGSNYCLHGPPFGGEPWLCPFNEAAVLAVGPRVVGTGEYLVKPVEEGPGQGLQSKAGSGHLFVEYRLAANPGAGWNEWPAVLVWKVQREIVDLVEVFRRPERSLRSGVPIEVLSMTPSGAVVRLE